MRLLFGPFVFDSRLRAVTRSERTVAMSPKAFLLLEALIEARPAPVSKAVLYDRLWPKTFVEPGNLHNLVAEIRRALDDRDHQIIRTTHGLGYCFDWREVDVPSSPSRFLLWIGKRIIHLNLGENIIGRDPECTIVIDSPDVSRQHIRLFVAEDHVTLEDLGSKNGTFIGSERVGEPLVLRAPVDLVVGKTPVLLRVHGNLKSTISA